MEIPNWKISH